MAGAYQDLAMPPSDRKSYREETDPLDERPVIRRRGFWASEHEAEAYLSAVRGNPRTCDPIADTIESPMTYIARIAAIVQRGPLTPAKAMPQMLTANLRATGLLLERSPGEDDE